MNKSYRIVALEAKDLFGAMNQVCTERRGYNLRCKDGSLNLRKFTNVFDWSLDAIKLREVYQNVYGSDDFGFVNGRHRYTQNISCVNFNYAYKAFNTAGKNTYIRNGYCYEDCEFTDGVCVRDGELIAIQTNVEVREPVSRDILGSSFAYHDGYYTQTGSIPTIMDKAELRNYLYTNGFTCDGIEYVRYKRSSGSSRVGKCLFVNKALAEPMREWDKCGLNIEEDQPLDLAAWEAYISLPISSIIDTIEIPLESILVIDDYESAFRDEVIAVEIEGDHLISGRKEVEIRNSIWDGQSMMDESLFGKYADKGMLLLRNRFFKSCCFNTKIQKWFSDNGITSIEQLNGFTLAKDISQVKLITTPSSIKYTKFGTVAQWMSNVSTTFGVVKYEKPPHAFGGRMVQAHYQLFNTLQLTYSEMESILEPSLKYISAIKRDPAVLRYAISYPRGDRDCFTALTTKQSVVFRMLGINDRFARTKLFKEFRDDLVKGEIRNLKRGHVLVNGNYSTLMGNGIEMLQAAIGVFAGESVLGAGNIHNTRFSYGQTILASRSPHVTVGNVLLVQNVACDMYDRYFNLTDCIVCVNAIGENIQQRLNGCDYDSDTMLLTDHPKLIEAAKRNYSLFPVPTNLTSSVKIARRYTQVDKADLDVKTSVNKIGEIINLSQELNSLMWDRISKGATPADCSALYCDICKLAVLSNVEIDRAKREFVINSGQEILALKKKYKIVDGGKTIKPKFFKMITTENGFELSDKIRYKYFNTPMDYLQKILSRFNFREGRAKKDETIPFMDIVKDPGGNVRQGYYYTQRDKTIDSIKSAREERKRLFSGYDFMSPEEKNTVWKMDQEIHNRCCDEISYISRTPGAMYQVLKTIDSPRYSDIARYVFSIVFSIPDGAFFTMLKESEERVCTLEESPDGELEFYGLRFKYALLREESASF